MRGDDKRMPQAASSLKERIPDIRLSLHRLVFRPIEHELWIAGNSAAYHGPFQAQRAVERKQSARSRTVTSSRLANWPSRSWSQVFGALRSFSILDGFIVEPPVADRIRRDRSSHRWGEPSASRIFHSHCTPRRETVRHYYAPRLYPRAAVAQVRRSACLRRRLSRRTITSVEPGPGCVIIRNPV